MKAISTIFSKLGNLFLLVSRKIYLSSLSETKGEFKRKIGDSTNLDCGLDENSVVFDVGGYEGQWASDIYSKFNSKIYVFEPVQNFADNIEKRFSKNNKIVINKFGLSDKTEMSQISLKDDSSSTINKKADDTTEIKLVDIIDFTKQNNITNIDLIKINIEGGEYALLNRLIGSGYIKNVKYILVQFHNFYPNAKTEMEKIRKELEKTHSPIYQFEFIWELWKLN